MKTIIKIVIALAVLNGLFRMGLLAADYYRLRDEAQQMILFGEQSAAEGLHSRILAKAEELGIPLEPQDLTVRRGDGRTYVAGAYQQELEYFPSFTYPVDLSFEVEAFRVESVK